MNAQFALTHSGRSKLPLYYVVILIISPAYQRGCTESQPAHSAGIPTVELTLEEFKTTEELIKEIVEVEVAKELLQHPVLTGRCSALCDAIAKTLREALHLKVEHVIGWWMGNCKDRNHEWLKVGDIMLDPSYVQYIKKPVWSWSEAKRAVQYSAQFYINDSFNAERLRRHHEKLPHERLEWKEP